MESKDIFRPSVFTALASSSARSQEVQTGRMDRAGLEPVVVVEVVLPLAVGSGVPEVHKVEGEEEEQRCHMLAAGLPEAWPEEVVEVVRR